MYTNRKKKTILIRKNTAYKTKVLVSIIEADQIERQIERVREEKAREKGRECERERKKKRKRGDYKCNDSVVESPK